MEVNFRIPPILLANEIQLMNNYMVIICFNDIR